MSNRSISLGMTPHFESADQLREWLNQQKRLRQRFEELLPAIQTEDGLVPSREITFDGSRVWRLKKDERVFIVPHWRVSAVANYLVEHPALWHEAAIRIELTEPIVGRVQRYGVPFQRALEIALREGVV